MKTRRILSLVLFLLFLASCAGNAPNTEEPPPPLIRVGFSQVGSESDWRLANTKSMTNALSEENGFELLFDNARQKQENQFLAIRNFIQQEVDYIVIAPISEYGWDSVLTEARDAGIPVIIMDRQIQVEDDSLYTCWIGSDFYNEGKIAVNWLDDQLALQKRTDEDINILHIQGTDGATAQLMRTKALEDAVAEREHWNIVAQLKGEYTEAKTYELVSEYLKTGESFDVIYSENDNMTFGALRALNEAGITHGRYGDVTVITFDAVREALQYCLNGKIDLCVECNPLHGPRVADIIRRLERGDSLSKKNYMEEISFSFPTLTPEIINAREY